MKIEELLEKKLLIKSNSSTQEIEGSLAIAEKFLERAKGNMKIEYFDVAFTLAYQSMFHSARALLFKNNFKERSHSALVQVLKEIYKSENQLAELLEAMNSYRISRHAVQYSGISCSKEDAVEIIKEAEKLIETADAIISKEKKKK